MANYYQQQNYSNYDTQYNGYTKPYQELPNQELPNQEQYHEQQEEQHQETHYQVLNYQHQDSAQNYDQQYETPQYSQQQYGYNAGDYSTTGYDQNQSYYNQTNQSAGYVNYNTQYGASDSYYSAPPLPNEPYPGIIAPAPDKKRKIREAQIRDAQAVARDAPKVFPVSCGTDHKKTAEGFVPKRPPIPPDVMSRIALAQSKLEINPHDQAALSQLHSAMMAYNAFQVDRQQSVLDQMNKQFNRHGSHYDGPGQFTGQPLVEPMNKTEIDSNDYRTYARPDMFLNLRPLRESYGRFIMKKMGWREGKPLGTSGLGSLAPIELTVKIDRKGLMNDMECVRRKPEGIAKNEGPSWICKIANTKSPISGLSEVHQAMGIPSPVYEVVAQSAGIYKWKVKTTWGSFTPFKATKNKKLAKAECAYHALKEILRIESERLGVEAPSETSESCFLRAIFRPSNKSVSGQKMLYKHFYKGGNLMNVKDREEYYNDANARTQRLVTKDQRNVIKLPVPKPNEIKPNENKGGKLLTGSNWIMKVVNGKNASSALLELCQAINQPRPNEYSQYVNKEHLVTVDTPWGSFTPEEGDKNRKDARRKASYHAIKEIMKLEADKVKSKPPIENVDSTDFKLSFSVATS